MNAILFASLLGAVLAPSLQAQNCFDPLVGADLGLGDDATAQGLSLGFMFPFAGNAYSQISVCSNGYLWLGPTSVTGADYTPTVAELRDGAPRICPLWTDLDPSATGGGHVYFKTLPGSAVITWAGVYVYGTTNPVDLQVVLSPTGHIDVTYGANAATGGTRAVLVGASPGGGAAVATVDFQVLPFLTGADSFAQLWDPTALAAPTGMRLNWSPASPGFAISEVACPLGTLPPPARVESVGVGCPRRTVSIYETFQNAVARRPVTVPGLHPLDLSGLALRFVPNGNGGYFVSMARAARYAPFGPTVLPAGDETTHRVLLPTPWMHAAGLVGEVLISANGFVTLGPTMAGSGCCEGNVVDLLAGPPRIAGFWTDLDVSAGGTLDTDFDPATGVFVVTWDQVPQYGTAAVNTLQIALEPSGVFTIQLLAVAHADPTAVALVGYSDGMSHGVAATDPGAIDFTGIVGTLDLGATIAPLQMEPQAGSLPRLGSTFVNHVTCIAPTPNGHLVAMMIGDETAPQDLAMFGAPGCFGLVAMPAPVTYVNVTFGAPESTFSIPIPNTIGLAGLSLMTQAASDDLTANLLGWRASNGGRWRIGL